jgi:tRNA(fMet)-specific endonuclease VapC
MDGSILLDTNATVAYTAGDLSLRVRITGSDGAFISCVTLGELHYGAQKSSLVEYNLARVGEIARTMPIIPCDEGTAAEYGIIKAALRAKGRPVPENDIWIAAIARQHALTLITRDEHFGEISGLVSEAW